MPKISILMKASKWILGTSQLEYKERLRRINLLPLALYHEMHVLLLFKFVKLEEGKTRRPASTGIFFAGTQIF